MIIFDSCLLYQSSFPIPSEFCILALRQTINILDIFNDSGSKNVKSHIWIDDCLIWLANDFTIAHARQFDVHTRR